MRRTRMNGTRLLLTAVATGGVLAIGACEGENLFSVPQGSGGTTGTDTEAPVVSISAPPGDSLSAKPVGDSVYVTAHVTDNVGLSSIRMYGVSFRGDVNLGTDTVVLRFQEKTITAAPGIQDTTIYRWLVPTPDSTPEKAWIVVEAADSTGNTSADSVQLALGGPSVTIDSLDAGFTAGGPLIVTVRARDPELIRKVSVYLTGVVEDTRVHQISPRDTVSVVDTFAIPLSAVGRLTIAAVAVNGLDVAGDALQKTITVFAPGGGDSIPPVLKHSSTAPDRMELKDSVKITVEGSDPSPGSGVALVGYTVLGISSSRADTSVTFAIETLGTPQSGNVARDFRFLPFHVDSVNLPDTLTYEITTWMKDADGNCAAAVGAALNASLPCDSISTPTGYAVVARGLTGQRVVRPVVAGETVLLPGGGRIMDAAVDTVRRRLYLSNISTNRLEVFDLQASRFDQAVGVGSEPWGLAFSRDGDSLWVANSGGTNLSVVDLGPRSAAVHNAATEVNAARFLTPDVALFEVENKLTEAGYRNLVTWYPQGVAPSFSDRPQFVAVDSFGNIIYSTKTTTAGELGTARKGYFDVAGGWERSEAKIFTEQGEWLQKESVFRITHIDSIAGSQATGWAFYDHVPGFPDQVISSPLAGDASYEELQTALEALIAGGSDAFVGVNQAWDVPTFTFRDTTYVAASGDGGWVAVGEGGSSPLGRVFTYSARPLEQTALSRSIQVQDLLTNPAEEVRGIGLNYDGTLGVVRGAFAAYFFSPRDLRLEGQTEIPSPGIGAGAVLHPLHANFKTLENLSGSYQPDTHLAFVASGEHTIDIIDTWRYTRIGRVYIRDVVTGPLRAVLPFDEDNASFNCTKINVKDKRGNDVGSAIQIYDGDTPIGPDGITEDRCVVMKLFATTSAGGVVVVDVRKADVLKEHPARN